MTFKELKKKGYRIQRVLRSYELQDVYLDEMDNLDTIDNHVDEDSWDDSLDEDYVGYDLFDPTDDLIYSVNSDDVDDPKAELAKYIEKL